MGRDCIPEAGSGLKHFGSSVGTMHSRWGLRGGVGGEGGGAGLGIVCIVQTFSCMLSYM